MSALHISIANIYKYGERVNKKPKGIVRENLGKLYFASTLFLNEVYAVLCMDINGYNEYMSKLVIICCIKNHEFMRKCGGFNV